MDLAKPVLSALTQFAAQASQLGGAGLVLLLIAALVMVFTIDRTLDAIWRVRTPRPIAQRVLVYWAAATLGPLVLGVSLSLTSYVISASRGIVAELPGGVSLLLNTIEFVLLAAGMAALFHYVPNTYVKWRHAIAGGVFVSIGFEVAKKPLAWYIAQVPTLAVVYGAFATLPLSAAPFDFTRAPESYDGVLTQAAATEFSVSDGQTVNGVDFTVVVGATVTEPSPRKAALGSTT